MSRPDATDPAVRVQALTRRFGDFTAVDAVTFDVRRGEVFGFLGPNGAGKTTTLKMLTGLVEPSEGQGWVAGLDITHERARIRDRIGYMSQRFSLYGDLTVEENIELFAGLYGVAGARLRDRRAWIEQAGLVPPGGQPAGELPLGWKQRLALGCAVLHEPQVLFLDEPTSGVDPLARRRFWDLIAELAAAGTTVIVSTHYMEEAEYCNRLALMNRGRLIALDTPRALRRAMTEPLFRATAHDPASTVQALTADERVVEAALYGRAVHVLLRDDADAETRARALLDDPALGLTGIERIPPSLEDVFVAAVRKAGGVVAG
ncbi:MAG: ABC transporter ATP-binding protein [Gemmatimonadetes bacterium]|nr:ABC transporter ATP-binding protein [Gemmatimonadota bacterium]